MSGYARTNKPVVSIEKRTEDTLTVKENRSRRKEG